MPAAIRVVSWEKYQEWLEDAKKKFAAPNLASDSPPPRINDPSLPQEHRQAFEEHDHASSTTADDGAHGHPTGCAAFFSRPTTRTSARCTSSSR